MDDGTGAGTVLSGEAVVATSAGRVRGQEISDGILSWRGVPYAERSHLWHAALADNLRRLGRAAEAGGELETAAALAPTEGERRLLLSRLLDVRPEPA
jgi:predicted RNA polymerase sigma factor